MFSCHNTTSSSRAACLRVLRHYSTTPPSKPPLKLVAELRKLTETSITKAREALVVTNNDVNAALEWLQKDLVVSGAKKAAKVDGRETTEGLIGVSVLSRGLGEDTGAVRAAMVEVNCETDFVGRNELFGRLVADVAHTAAFLGEQPEDLKEIPVLLRPFPLEMLLEAPLLSLSNPNPTPSTVGSAIRDTIAKVGEKITLRRAAFAALNTFSNQPHRGTRVTSYVHGGTTIPSQGRIGALALLKLKSPQLSTLIGSEAFLGDLEKLERSLSRQIVGFDTRSISPFGNDLDTALYEQPFMTFAGASPDEQVKAVLRSWAEQRGMILTPDNCDGDGVQVSEFTKWTVGERLEEDAVWVVSDVLSKIKHQSSQ